MEPVAAELLKNGILGLVALIFILACWKLWSDGKEAAQRSETSTREVAKRHEEQLKAIHDQRVTDYQAMTTVLLKANAENVSVLTTVVNGMEAQKEAMGELKDAFKSSRRI